jgi:uncharacterized protein YbjT (DUF2867 family)
VNTTLVVGGSGIFGRALVKRLADSGKQVRVMSRSPERCAELVRPGVEVVKGDLLDETSLAAALAGVSSVVAAAHSLVGRGKYSSEAVDGAGTERLIASAERSGVERLLYLSVHLASPEHSLDFWRTKARIESVLQASRLHTVALRPTAYMDFHADKLIGEPIRRGKPVMLFGSGTLARNFVAADDVAALAAHLLDRPEVRDETIDVGGPEELSSRDVVRTYEEHTGARAKVISLPLGLARSVAFLSKPFHPGVSRVLRTVVMAETQPQPFDYSALEARFGLRFRSLREWLASTPAQVA